MNINKLDTEQRNPNTDSIDQCNTLDIVIQFNKEDSTVADNIQEELPKIANIIDLGYQTLKNNGRIIYLGAGNSGRMAACDACECIPTFGIEPNTILCVIAGGDQALHTAIEGSEDDTDQCINDLNQVNLSSKDLVIGLSASGRTPYVKHGLIYATKLGCQTASISCSFNSEISEITDISVEIPVGPEIITGSTRLKAGTAQKMILNMISSGVMIKMGKVYKNYMVDVSIKNKKLFERAKKIIMEVTGVSASKAEKTLSQSNGNVKNAILMITKNISYEESIELIHRDPYLRNHIE